MPVRIVEMAVFGSPSTRFLRAAPPSFQSLTISSRSETRRSLADFRYCGAAVAIAAGAVGEVVVGVGPLAGARAGAVQVLTPQQEFDGVIAGGHIGLDAAGLLQRAGEELRRQARGVDLLAVDLDRLVGDHIGRVERIRVRLGAVALGDIIDQAFVQRPGIHLAFPIVDDGVAEAIDFGLLVRNARCLPGLARRIQRFLAEGLAISASTALSSACAVISESSYLASAMSE